MRTFTELWRVENKTLKSQVCCSCFKLVFVLICYWRMHWLTWCLNSIQRAIIWYISVSCVGVLQIKKGSSNINQYLGIDDSSRDLLCVCRFQDLYTSTCSLSSQDPKCHLLHYRHLLIAASLLSFYPEGFYFSGTCQSSDCGFNEINILTLSSPRR